MTGQEKNRVLLSEGGRDGHFIPVREFIALEYVEAGKHLVERFLGQDIGTGCTTDRPPRGGTIVGVIQGSLVGVLPVLNIDGGIFWTGFPWTAVAFHRNFAAPLS